MKILTLGGGGVGMRGVGVSGSIECGCVFRGSSKERWKQWGHEVDWDSQNSACFGPKGSNHVSTPFI